ncbi:universal stress protein [Marilutibacter maris]|uniref:universal stress protein n=1 Tax=Marilutibacter maris TaxID=1605891 RepID=UPI000DAA736D|nr:universal stress protein [Lysobacter maris]
MVPIGVLATRPHRILLATDLTSRCDRAFDRATLLAREWEAQLHVLHAIESEPPAAPMGVDPESYARTHPDPVPAAHRALKRLVGDASAAYCHVETCTAAKAILAIAASEACDLIVLGESRVQLVGPVESTLEQVVRKAPVSTLIVRSRPQGEYRRVIVGTDFTDEARQALAWSAKCFRHAWIRLVHASWVSSAGWLDSTTAVADDSEQKLARLRAQLDESELADRTPPIEAHVEVGHPAAVLRRCAESIGADLVVIGAYERSMLFNTVVGNMRSIVRGTSGDILVVRAARDRM